MGRRQAGHPGCIDLFAGAGGLAEGFRQAGWRILAAVDNDRYAAKTFRLNFPEAAFLDADLAEIEPEALLQAARLRRGELDCLLGGPPCQSFSYNNHARSASDERARLFRHYLRIIEVLHPKTLVMENVPGMLTIGGGQIVTEIQEKLAELGYEVGIRILHTEDFGVPQERRRVFIVGTRLGWEDPLFPPGTHGPSPKPADDDRSVQGKYIHRWKPRKGRQPLPLVSVWEAIGDLPPLTNGGPEATTYICEPQTEFQHRARGGASTLYNHFSHALSPTMLQRITHVPEGGNWRNIPQHFLPAGMRRAREKDHTKRYGRLSREGLCCTILTKCDPHWGSYIHPTQDRTISVREAARLQSFPDSFRFYEGVSKQYQQVGNAVPPLVAKCIAQALKRHIVRKAPYRGASKRFSEAAPSAMRKGRRQQLPAYSSPLPARSENMRAIRSRGNRTTEKRLRALLAQGRFRDWTTRPVREIGSPDFTFPKARVAIFVDGCFWHSCPRCGHVPKTNVEYWSAKIARNRRRDRAMSRAARERGYRVIRLWECQLRKAPKACLGRIQRALREMSVTSANIDSIR